MNFTLLFDVLGVLCLILASFGVPSKNLSLGWAGLAVLAANHLF